MIEAPGAPCESWPCGGGGKVGRHGEMGKIKKMGRKEWDGGFKGGGNLPLFILL